MLTVVTGDVGPFLVDVETLRTDVPFDWCRRFPTKCGLFELLRRGPEAGE